MQQVFIVSATRTPTGKAPRGQLSGIRPDELAVVAVRGCLDRVPFLDRNQIDDVIMGCAFPEIEQGWNVARTIAIRAGIPNRAAAMTVNRFCSSGLQAIALAAAEINCGWAEIVVAGGVESMSTIPLGGMKQTPNPYLMEHYPEYYLGMGLTAEEVAERYGVSRAAQDEFALQSYTKAETAIVRGMFRDEIQAVPTEVSGLTKPIDTDEIKRGVTLAGLEKLKPVFKMNGTVTAANCSQTSDGAAAVVVMSEAKVKETGAVPLAILKTFAVAGVDPDVMGIGPIAAIPKALKQAGLSLSDIGLFELNEAFAAQAIACIRALEIDPGLVNVNGGAIALGHPLGCTGAKLTTSLLYEMRRCKVKFGVVSMCIGGGMGAAGVFELA